MDAVIDRDDPTPTTLFGDPVVEEARKRWDRCAEFESMWRTKFLDDLKFANADSDNGYQWPNSIRRSRDVENRPCLTMNIIRQHNLQIVNQARQNKSSVKIVATGGEATTEAANIFKALVRNTEYVSNAEAAYRTARKYQVDGGYGAWRLTTGYVSDKTFDQEIYIDEIPDPLSIYGDCDGQRSDGLDWKYAFAFDNVPKAQFRDAYPKWAEMAGQQPLGIGSTDDDYVTKDFVRVCEYFRIVTKPDKLVSFIDPASGERKCLRKSFLRKAGMDEVLEHRLTKMRDIEPETVEWKLIVGQRVIDETIWLGRYIPIVRIIGEESRLDGILDRKGHTRSMKDAQRMYNYNADLSIDTRVPTPFGWTTIGQISDGDWVFDQKGQPVQVEKALPIKYNERCFKITFDTGYSVVSNETHIWKIEERGKRKAATFDWKERTVCTGELVPGKHFITVTAPLELEAKYDLPIDPYILGVWLGDGSSAAGRISAHQDDASEERCLIEQRGFTTGEIRQDGDSKGVSFTIFGLRTQLNAAGLLGEKHIPRKYFRGSKEQRLELLRGLMDTDGHFAPKVNQCIFINTNREIIQGILELCASLGIKTTLSKHPAQVRQIKNRECHFSKESYRVQFTADPDVAVFNLTRKVEQQTASRKTHWRRTKRHGIVSIVEVPSVPVRCLTLDTADHLYLCGEGMIPTHNSAQVEFVALQGKTPWVAAVKAIEELEQYWNSANTTNHSVLPYNHVDDSNPDRPIPPPQRQEPPRDSPAYQSGMETAFNQMMMTSGQYQNQLGMQGNERTGAAIGKRQQQSDTSTFHFQDNFAEGLRTTGKMLIDLYPKVYVAKRVMKILADDGSDLEVEVNPAAKQAYQQMVDHRGKVVKRIFNPSLGEYDVAADVGPSYGTRREESLEALTLILTQAPGLTGIVGDLLFKNMDIEEAQEAAQRLKRMVPPQALGQGPSAKEQELQQQIQALSQALTKSLQRVAKTDLKLVGKDQMRDIDAHEAETKRMAALAKLLPMDHEGLQDIIHQLVKDSLSTQLVPIIQANRNGLGQQSGTEPEDEPAPPGDQPQLPTMPHGARKAPDGQWYLADPTRRGRYLRIAPLAQEHSAEGIVANG